MTSTAHEPAVRGTRTRPSSRKSPPELPPQEWLLQAAADEMTVGLLVHDRTGRIVFANRAAEQMLGLSHQELHGRSAFDAAWFVCDEEGRPIAASDRPALAALRSGQPVLGTVLGIRSGHGDLRWFRADSRPLRRHGALLASATTFEDITAERQVRSSLARAESRLERARAAGGVALWEYELPADLITGDDGLNDISGHRITCGEEWMAAIHPDDREIVASVVSSFRQGARRGEAAYRFVRPDGEVRWVSSQGQVVETAPDGQATKVAGAVVDITDIHRRSAEMRQLMDFMNDGYFTLTPEWRVGFANRRASELLQYSLEELDGADLWELFPHAVGSAFEANYRRAMSGEPVEFPAYYPAPLDGWYEVRAYPIPTGIAVHFRNTTAERRASEERENLLCEARQAQERLLYQATHDTLTGLPNRVALTTWLEEQLETGGERDRLWVMFIDLDRFKLVNDTYGHGTGDEVLQQAAQRLRACTGPTDVVARLGGDEFIVALADSDGRRANVVASGVLEAFRRPVELGTHGLVLTASIGITVGTERATAESLIRDADIALYKAKDSGRNQIAVFGSRLRRDAWRRLATETDLRVALSRNDIIAHYQPLYDLATGDVVGVEALARWTTPAGRMVPPEQFIPVAEESGLILPLGQRIFDDVGEHLPDLHRALVSGRPVVWVNVSTRQLDEPSFVEQLVGWAQERHLLGLIGLEITESALGRNDAAAHAALDELACAGFFLAIDDFGTGYSSLSRLAGYPVDLLKIDRSFVRNLATPTGIRIVRTIVELAHSLGSHACAEGVESDEELEILRSLGVDKVSGYHLCRPTPLPQLGEAAKAGTELLRSVCSIRAPR